jgi:predicted  nucleic acid-binding Zn-ribbon protein
MQIDLIAHLVTSIVSAAGGVGGARQWLTKPIATSISMLSKRIDRLEKRIDEVASPRASLPDASSYEELWRRVGELEKQDARAAEERDGIWRELERVRDMAEEVRSDLRHTVTDEEHQAFATQVMDKLHSVSEKIGFVSGRLKGPSRGA